MLWPGLEECAWSTADYSVELSAKKVLICASLCVRVFAYNIYMFPAFMVAIKMCAYVGVSTLMHAVAGKKALHPFVYN